MLRLPKISGSGIHIFLTRITAGGGGNMKSHLVIIDGSDYIF